MIQECTRQHYLTRSVVFAAVCLLANDGWTVALTFTGAVLWFLCWLFSKEQK